MIHIVYVVHNSHPAKAAALPVFLKWKKLYPERVRILCADNSDAAYKAKNPVDREDMRKVCPDFFREVKYLNTGDNPGLPAAYNQALQVVQDRDPAGWLMIADEDTFFPEEYLKKAFDVLENPPEGLAFMTGLIRSGGQAMSPTKGYQRKTLKRDYVTRAGHYKNIFCINSGLIISAVALQKVGGYDEDYFLDMTDHDLMERLKRAGLSNAEVLPVKIEQQFSGRTEGELPKQRARYEIYKKDFKTFCRKHGKSKMYCRTEIAKRWLMLYTKYTLCKLK